MSLLDFSHQNICFVTGSQHLYGPDALAKVGSNSKILPRLLVSSFSLLMTQPRFEPLKKRFASMRFITMLLTDSHRWMIDYSDFILIKVTTKSTGYTKGRG